MNSFLLEMPAIPSKINLEVPDFVINIFFKLLIPEVPCVLFLKIDVPYFFCFLISGLPEVSKNNY